MTVKSMSETINVNPIHRANSNCRHCDCQRFALHKNIRFFVFIKDSLQNILSIKCIHVIP